MLHTFAAVLLFSALQCTSGAQGATDSIGDMMARSPVQMAPDTASVDGAGEIIRGLARIPAPGRAFVDKVDPVVVGENSCDRDFEQFCPEGWVNVGPVKGGSTEYCHGGSQYFGPCSGELQAFSNMSTTAKKRWSRGCQAFFPCKDCKRDYKDVCPEGWAQVEGAQKCKPQRSYAGPCRGDANFHGYNTAMLEAWSDLCGAYWRCSLESVSEQFVFAYPISMDATLARIAKGFQ